MKKLLAVLSLGMLAACEPPTPGVGTSRTDNQAIWVDHLFTTGGCKVYRFEDDHRLHYFANCGTTGSTSSVQQEGKTYYIENIGTVRIDTTLQIDTVRVK